MTTFTINDENEIVAFASPEEAAATTTTPFDSFGSQQELAELASAWPADRFVAIWNSLAGVVPVKKFKSTKTAVARIWERIQGLGEAADPATEPEKPKATTKAKGRAQAAKGAPAKGKATKKATPAKNAPKGKKAAKARGSGRAPRGHQDGAGGCHAAAEERSNSGRDNGKNGLATPHRPRLHGGRHEEGRVHRRILQARRGRTNVSNQQVASARLPFRPPGSGRGGLLACGPTLPQDGLTRMGLI